MAVARVDRVPFSLVGFGNTITHDLVHGVPSALGFFDPPSPSALASKLIERVYPRAELSSILRTVALENSAPEVVLKNIELLQDSRTLVVATGQQAGFLGGPLFSIHKALSAIAQARAFSEELKIPVVPVFWVAADDHDQAEIDHAYVLKADGELARIRAECDAATLGCSAADLRLQPDGEYQRKLIVELAEALGAEDAAREIVALYAELGFGRAFTRLMYRWLGSLGLIVAPSNVLRPLAKPILLGDLADYDVVSRLIQESGVKMKALGYELGFSSALRTAPHFFIATETHNLRVGLEARDDGGFEERSPILQQRGVPSTRYTRAALSALIERQPERFSSSAALRPVVQQAILPVLSVVLGPGEVAYWAQLRGVHAHFGIPWPRVSVRASITLLDGAGAKAARKLGLAPDSPDLFLAEAGLRKKLLTGGEMGQKLQARTRKILSELDEMQAEIRAVEGGLDPLFVKTRERIAHELERIAEKTNAAIGQREGAGVNRIKYLSSLVRPREQLQERVLCSGSFLWRMPRLTEELLPHIPPSVSEHLVFTLE
jgi:bacillithiol biosynthesis cysteine-adding enzyme BshC